MAWIQPIAFGIIAATIPLQAQNNPPKAPQGQDVPDEMDLMFELMDLLATPISGASKREQRLMDSPQAIEVLTAEDIRRMGIYRIQDALKLMTSVDYLEADHHVIGMRGVMQDGYARTVQLLVDGVPLYSALSGPIDYSNLPLPIHMVDKIEVVRGPSSTLYGANAVCGVIAITTRRPEKGFKSEGRISKANHITWRGGANASFGFEKFSVIAGYTGHSMQASEWNTHFVGRPNVLRYYQNEPQSEAPFANPFIASDGNHGFNGLARMDFKHKDTSIWAQAGEARKTFGGSSYFKFRYDTMNLLLAGWRQGWTPTLSTELRVHRTEKHASMGHSPDLAEISGDTSFLGKYGTVFHAVTTQAEVQINWTITPKTFLVAGADRRVINSDKSRLAGLPKDEEESASGGFLALDYKAFEKWTFSAGLRAENESLGGSRISPRATVVYNPNPKTVLRAGYYTSTRSPQIAEARNDFRFFAGDFYNPATQGVENANDNPMAVLPTNYPIFKTVKPNPNLKPEETENIELGLRQLVGSVSLDLTLYHMKFSQMMVIEAEPAEYLPGPLKLPLKRIPFTYGTYVNKPTIWTNIGQATNMGVEAAATWSINKQWTAGLNAAWLKYTKDEVDPKDPMGEDFAYAVDLKANAWVRFSQGKFSGYAALQHMGKTTAEAISASADPYFEPRDAFFQFSANVDYAWNPHFGTGLYLRNGARNMTPQGASCIDRGSAWVGMRREYGFSASYRF